MNVRRWISEAASTTKLRLKPTSSAQPKTGESSLLAVQARLVAAGLLLMAVPVVAHHSIAAAYDSTKSVEVQGTVTKVLLKNPHGFVFIESTDEKGQKIEWAVEMGAATGMIRQGWTTDTLPPGTVVKVVGIPSRAAGSHGITQARFTRPDGTPIGPPARAGGQEAPAR